MVNHAVKLIAAGVFAMAAIGVLAPSNYALRSENAALKAQNAELKKVVVMYYSASKLRGEYNSKVIKIKKILEDAIAITPENVRMRLVESN
jgi:hypothetical protein